MPRQTTLSATSRLILLSVVLVSASVPLWAESGQTARGRGTAGPPVAPEKLEALLPVVKGWQKGQSDSETMNVGIVMSVARVSYEKGDLGVSLEITDTLGNAMLMGPVQTMLSSATPAGKTVDGVTAKTFAVGGFTGVEVWDSKEKVADAIVAVGGRFLVKASQSDARDTTAVRAVVEVVNLKALADLK